MPTPILTRQRTPFDGVPAEVFADLAAFVRRVDPCWLDGSDSLARLTARRARQRERARSSRRGYRLLASPKPAARSGRVARRRSR